MLCVANCLYVAYWRTYMYLQLFLVFFAHTLFLIGWCVSAAGTFCMGHLFTPGAVLLEIAWDSFRWDCLGQLLEGLHCTASSETAWEASHETLAWETRLPPDHHQPQNIETTVFSRNSTNSCFFINFCLSFVGTIFASINIG